MSAHQTRLELNEVPFGSRCLNDVVGVDAHSIEYLCQLVHKGDIDIALRIFNYLRSFSNADARCFMRTIDEH